MGGVMPVRFTDCMIYPGLLTRILIPYCRTVRTASVSVPTYGLSTEWEFMFMRIGVFSAQKSCGFCG